MQMNIEQLFFFFFRVSIGMSGCLSKTPTNEEWKALYDMAKKQTLVGVCFVGVQKLVNQQQEPPEMLYLTWMGMAALMYVLHVVFGMKHELMLCEPNEKDGAFLLDDIMQAGNFGHHDARNKKFDMGSYWQNFFVIMRNIAYFRFAPWNWLMSPMWRVYHFVWRKVNRYE